MHLGNIWEYVEVHLFHWIEIFIFFLVEKELKNCINGLIPPTDVEEILWWKSTVKFLYLSQGSNFVFRKIALGLILINNWFLCDFYFYSFHKVAKKI